MESYINVLVLFKTNKSRRDGMNSSKFTAGLLLEDLPTKEFKSK